MKSVKKFSKESLQESMILLRQAVQYEKFEDALAIIDEVIKYQDTKAGEDTNFSSIWSTKGEIYKNLGRFEEALAAYFRSLNTKNFNLTSFYLTHISIAKIYTMLDNKAEAFVHYEKALKNYKPGHINYLYEIYENKAKLYVSLFKFEEAIKCYKELIKIKLDQGNKVSEEILFKSYSDLGYLYLIQSKHFKEKDIHAGLKSIDESIKIYNYISKKFKDFFDSSMLVYAIEIKALLLVEISSSSDALELLYKTVEIYPNLDLYKRIGIIRSNEIIKLRKNEGDLKNIEKSIEDAEKLIRWYYESEKKGFEVDIDNNKSVLKFYIGISHTILKNLQEAEKAYKEAIKMGFDEEKCKANLYLVLVDLSQLNLEKHNYDGALKYIDEALEFFKEIENSTLPIDKNDIDKILFTKGTVHFELNQHRKALNCFEQILNPKSEYQISMLNQTSLCLMNLNKFEDAIKCFDKLIDLDPINKNSYIINKAGMLEELKNYPKALECVDLVLSILPDNCEALSMKAGILLGVGKYEESELLINRCERFGYKKPLFYLVKSKIESNKGNFHEAIKLVDKAIELGIKDPETYNYRGCTLFKLGCYKDSLESFNIAVNLSNEEELMQLYIAYTNMAACFNKLEEYHNAIELSNSALRINPVSLEAYYNMAIAYFSLGLYDDSMSCFDKPNFKEVSSAISQSQKCKQAYRHVSYEKHIDTTAKVEEHKAESESEESEKIHDVAVEHKADMSIAADTKIAKEYALEALDSFTTDLEVNEFSKYVLEEKKAIALPSTFVLSSEEKKLIKKMIFEYFSSTYDILKQEEIDNNFTKLLNSNPHFKSFVVELFTIKNDIEGKSIISKLLNSDNLLLEELSYYPKFIEQFWYKQKMYMKSEIELLSHVEHLDKTDSLKGVHKILTNKSFKGTWFFSFSDAILNNPIFNEMLEKLKPNVNSLKILPGDSKGQTGFKENIISIKGEEDFPMIRLKTLDTDIQIYSRKITTCFDNILNKTLILSILDQFASHKEMKKIINGNHEGFQKIELSIDEFYQNIVGKDSEIDSDSFDV